MTNRTHTHMHNGTVYLLYALSNCKLW